MTFYKNVHRGVAPQDVIVVSFTGDIDSDGYWKKAYDAYVKNNAVPVSKDMAPQWLPEEGGYGRAIYDDGQGYSDFEHLFRLLESSPEYHNLLAPPFHPGMTEQEMYAAFHPDFTRKTLKEALQREGGVEAITSYLQAIVAERARDNAIMTVGFSPAKSLQVTLQAEGFRFGRASDESTLIEGETYQNDNDDRVHRQFRFFEKGKWSVASSADPVGEVTGVVLAVYRKVRWWQVRSGSDGEWLAEERIPFTIPAGSRTAVIEVERKFPEKIKEMDNWIDLRLSVLEASAPADPRPAEGGLRIIEPGYTWQDTGTDWEVRPVSQRVRLDHPLTEEELDKRSQKSLSRY